MSDPSNQLVAVQIVVSSHYHHILVKSRNLFTSLDGDLLPGKTVPTAVEAVEEQPCKLICPDGYQLQRRVSKQQGGHSCM